MGFEHLKGFRDIFPEDAQVRLELFSKMEDVASRFGFAPIEYPSVEPLDLFRIKSGDELVKQTFSFKDKGGREVTLIPEATPSTVRLLTSRKEISKPVRWYSMPKLWRYEEPQSGRLREHVQFNADIFGSDSIYADAEIIGLAANILDDLGLNEEYEIRLNDRNLMNNILSSLGISNAPATLSIIDHYGKVENDTLLSELSDQGIDDEQAESVIKLLEKNLNPPDLMDFLSSLIFMDDKTVENVNRLEDTYALIKKYTSTRIVVSLSTVRGLGYYTGIVFEGFDKKGELRAIFGGGRYDNLSNLLSEQSIPAVGFGMGDAVLEILMKRTGKWKSEPKRKRYAVCCTTKKLADRCIDLTMELRDSGASAISDLNGRSLSAQLKNASSNNCDYAVIIGEKDIRSGDVTLRTLKTGEQSQISIEKLLKAVRG
ncbi:MAG: histidine--tRNA ligase [Thermoplasmatales archaeon]|nr:histidine--tRNA ligase [Thermoplasmatales archaeon]MCW6169754.1 histidine--tRNA ligase [Thermoplasmatales archaeon]